MTQYYERNSGKNTVGITTYKFNKNFIEEKNTKMKNFFYWMPFLMLNILFGVGCTVNEIIHAETSKLDIASLQISESMLLDVGITNFDSGIPEDNDVQKTGIYPEVRKAESRYFSYHIKTTLQGTGFWGAVRVVPSKYAFSDVMVSGVIEKSDGEFGQLLIKAEDITGTQWFERSYSIQTSQSSFSEWRDRSQDPYQKMFNDFANDLRIYALTLTPKDISRIRQVTELKFFGDMAPTPFNEYLITDAEGLTAINRLPAKNDPMADRLRSIRARDYLVVDTLNEHYANFYYGVAIPYEGWRRVSRQEHVNYRMVRKSGLQKILLGAAVVLGSVEVGNSGRGYARRSASRVGMNQGFKTIMDGLTRRKEAKIHLVALQELSESFVSEAAPMTITVDGEVRRLTGTAESQYEGWRKLMKNIYQAETEFANNVEIGVPTRQ